MYLIPERAIKIGLVLTVVSVLLLGYSSIGIYSSMSSFENRDVAAQNENSTPINVTSGLLITYTVSIKTNQSNRFTAWLTEPSGVKVLESNFTSSGISKSMVAPITGKWIFHVKNDGNNSSQIRIHIGQTSFYLEAGLYGGITMLILGLVFLGYSFNVQRRETIRKSERYR
ncbi:MAG: hypothetical protein ACYCSO_07125 [Cuniculiplasma sp.]